MLRTQLSVLALLAVAGVATAQTGAVSSIKFVEIPGQMEFTGRLIVKPATYETLRRLGYNDIAIEAKRRAAEVGVAAMTVSYIPVLDYYVLQIPAGYNETTLGRELQKSGNYEIVEPDYRVFPQFTPNDPSLGQQWSVTNNQATNAWDIFRGNAGVTIAITDTGVHKTHEDFNIPTSRFVNGFNALTNQTEAAGGFVGDTNGHGTHCAGIAAATGDNGRGVTGVNIEGTKIMSVKIDNGGGTSYSVLTNGALWAAQNGARIVSTSYSGVQSTIIRDTGTTIRNTYNALWFYAAGNDGGTYGAANDWANVTIVGSISSNNSLSGFSARGEFIDVMAPGDNIFSTIWTSNSNNASYAFLTGTSMACPYAAGVAGAILGMNPNLAAGRVEDILERTSISFNAPATVGWGRVNFWNAMGRVANSFTLFRGTAQGGALADLYRVDGGALRVGKGITVNAGEAPVQVVTEHNVATFANYSEINVMNTARVNTSGAIRRRVQLFNFATNQYDTLGETGIGTSYGVQDVSATTNPTNYISGGIVRVRTQVFTTGPVSLNNWIADFDQINVRTLKATQ